MSPIDVLRHGLGYLLGVDLEMDFTPGVPLRRQLRGVPGADRALAGASEAWRASCGYRGSGLAVAAVYGRAAAEAVASKLRSCQGMTCSPSTTMP